MSFFDLFWSCPATFGKTENSRNQLNNWKKIFPDQVQAQGHKFSTKICSVVYRYVSADLILWLLVMLLFYKNGYNVPNLIQ